MIEDKRPEKKDLDKIKIRPKKEKKACFTWKRCCCSCLVVIALVILAILIVFSLAGFGIPLLRPIFYGDGPDPVREVEAVEIGEEYINNLFSRAVNNKESQVIITEKELSYFIDASAKKRQESTTGNNPDFSQVSKGGYSIEAKGGQAAIEKDFIEIFIELEKPPSVFIIRLEPYKVNGEEVFRTKSLKFGKLPLPAYLANFYIPYITQDLLRQVDVKSYKLERGKIILEIDPYELERKMQEEREGGNN